MNITKEQLALKFHETYERLAPEFGYETRSDTKKFDSESNNGRLMIAVCEAIMRGLEDAAPVCNHEWFQTGAMLSNEKRCIKCGEWGKLYTSPQAAQTEAHGLESLFSEWFDSTPHGEPSPRETFEAGYQAGRAGSKP